MDTMTAQLSDQRTDKIDSALADLTAGAGRWAALGLTGRRELLEAVGSAVAAVAPEWVSVAAGYKGLPPESPLMGEEWLSGPYAVLTGLSALAESMRALEADGSPLDGFDLGTAPGNRLSVKVLPHGIFDELLLSGFSADVWMQPGVTAEQVRAQAGLGQRTPASPAASDWCSARATSPPFRRWTCCTSCTPTTGSCYSSSTP